MHTSPTFIPIVSTITNEVLWYEVSTSFWRGYTFLETSDYHYFLRNQNFFQNLKTEFQRPIICTVPSVNLKCEKSIDFYKELSCINEMKKQIRFEVTGEDLLDEILVERLSEVQNMGFAIALVEFGDYEIQAAKLFDFDEIHLNTKFLEKFSTNYGVQATIGLIGWAVKDMQSVQLIARGVNLPIHREFAEKMGIEFSCGALYGGSKSVIGLGKTGGK